MKTQLSWQFDTKAEVLALAEHVAATWDGITFDEAHALAEQSFNLGWKTVGDHFDGMTVNGAQYFPPWMERNKLLMGLGYTAGQVYTDSVCKLLTEASMLSRYRVTPPYYEESGAPELIPAALKKLGSHLQKARPKGWRSARPPQPVGEADYAAFHGHKTRYCGAPDFVGRISLAYLKPGVDEHDDVPFDVLVQAIYAHGYLLHEMVNAEALGVALASIDTEQPYVGPNMRIQVTAVPLFQRYLALAAKKSSDLETIVQLIDWVPITPAAETSCTL